MKKFNRCLSLLLALVTLVGLLGMPYAFDIIDGKVYDDGKLIGEIDENAPSSPIISEPFDVTALTAEQKEAYRTSSKFSDVSPDAWYAEAVNAMASTGLLAGYEDGTFRPERNITVGEWCAILMRIETFKNADISGGYTRPHWAGGIVETANNFALTRVFPTKDADATHWREDELVNRGEAITGIVKLTTNAVAFSDVYSSIYNKIVSAKTASPNYRSWTMEDIPDHAVIEANNSEYGKWSEIHGWNLVPHSWDVDRILKAYNEGLMAGVDSAGTCAPLSNLTRAEACQLLYTAGLTWCLNIAPLNSGLGDFRPTK